MSSDFPLLLFSFYLKKDVETVLTLPGFIFFCDFFSRVSFTCDFPVTFLLAFFLYIFFFTWTRFSRCPGPDENNFVFHCIGRCTHFKVKYRSFHDLVVITKGKQKLSMINKL